MIRIRRTATKLPPARVYEIELVRAPTSSTERLRLRRGRAVRRLEELLGTGDAWSFVRAADEAWDRGERGWALEWEEQGRYRAEPEGGSG